MKITKTATLAAALSVAVLSSQAALTASWDFNNANDSVSSTTGTLVGGATISGGQLNLTGTGGFDSNTAGGLGGTGSFTIVADFATTATSDQTVFAYNPGNGETGGGDIRLFAQANGNLRIEMNLGAGFEQDLGALNVNDGATHRIAAIFDSSLGNSFLDVDLYVDATLYNVAGGTDHPINLQTGTAADDDVSFGFQLNNVGNRTFTGTIELGQIYDTALTGTAITAIPEPAAIGLVGLFGGGILLLRRKLIA